jgi:hypothetical protein
MGKLRLRQPTHRARNAAAALTAGEPAPDCRIVASGPAAMRASDPYHSQFPRRRPLRRAIWGTFHYGAGPALRRGRSCRDGPDRAGFAEPVVG